MPKVLNIRTDNICRAVRVDRGTKYGNPFIVGEDGSRTTVCRLFERYAKWRLTVQPQWLDDLRGKDVACWCAPKLCHGETLIRLANANV